MTEQLIRPTTIGSLIKALSGLFITKDNPSGLTPKELKLLCVLYPLCNQQVITREHKVALSDQMNQSLQVTVNYINRFKAKGVITKSNKLHPVFFINRIIIESQLN